MSESSNNQVYLVTGVRVAIDSEHKLLIAGIFSENPFMNNDQDVASQTHSIGNFAFTRQHATFLRDRINEFLKDEE